MFPKKMHTMGISYDDVTLTTKGDQLGHGICKGTTDINIHVHIRKDIFTYGNRYTSEGLSLPEFVPYPVFRQSSTRWPIVRCDHTMLMRSFHPLAMVLLPNSHRVGSQARRLLPSFVSLPRRSPPNKDAIGHGHEISEKNNQIHLMINSSIDHRCLTHIEFAVDTGP